jgi:hypothetical protein
MARKRITYQTEALYVGTTGQSSPDQLHRIQTASHNVDVQYVDINEMGRLAKLSSELIEAPVVNLEFSYYVVDGYNESTAGFTVPNTSDPLANIISGFLSDHENEEKNYYLLTVPEGKEASDGSSSYGLGNGVLGVGNGFITSYGVEASVGEIPTANISIEGANLRFDTGSNSIPNPAINTENGDPVNHNITIPVSTTGTLSAAALRPGDVVMDFGDDGLDQGGAVLPGMDYADSPLTGTSCIQSFSLDVPLSRTPMLCLTKFYPITRNLDFPTTATLSVNAGVADISSGALNEIICHPEKTRDITITMYNKCREGTSIIYRFKNAILDSQAMSNVFDSDKTVDLVFSTTLDSSSSIDNGVFINGSIDPPPPTTTTTGPPTTTTTTTTGPPTTTTTTTTTTSTTIADLCEEYYCVSNFKLTGGSVVSNANGAYQKVNLGGGNVGWRMDAGGSNYSYIKKSGNDFYFEIWAVSSADTWAPTSADTMICPNIQSAGGGTPYESRVYQKAGTTQNTLSVKIDDGQCPVTTTTTTGPPTTTTTTTTGPPTTTTTTTTGPPTTTTTTTTGPPTTTTTTTTTASPTSPPCEVNYCVPVFKTSAGTDVPYATGLYSEVNLGGGQYEWRTEVISSPTPKYSYIKRTGDDYKFEIYNGFDHNVWSGAVPTGMKCPNELSDANGGDFLTDRVYMKGTENSQSVITFSNECPYLPGCLETDAYPYYDEYTVFWEDTSYTPPHDSGELILRRSPDTGAYGCWAWTGENVQGSLFIFPEFGELQSRASLFLYGTSDDNEALINESWIKGDPLSGGWDWSDFLDRTARVSGNS